MHCPWYFSQLSKLACIPVTLAIQYVLYSQSVSRKVQMTLLPITFGVGFATVYDLDINFKGLGKCVCYMYTFTCISILVTHLYAYCIIAVFATAAVVATSLAQIYTSSYQKSLECDALQLLYHTSPIIAAVR